MSAALQSTAEAPQRWNVKHHFRPSAIRSYGADLRQPGIAEDHQVYNFERQYV